MKKLLIGIGIIFGIAALVDLKNYIQNKTTSIKSTSSSSKKRLCQWCSKVDLDEYGSYECIPLVERKTSYENFRSSPNGIYCQACMIGWGICK